MNLQHCELHSSVYTTLNHSSGLNYLGTANAACRADLMCCCCFVGFLQQTALLNQVNTSEQRTHIVCSHRTSH